jgi:hypothetical protein
MLPQDTYYDAPHCVCLLLPTPHSMPPLSLNALTQCPPQDTYYDASAKLLAEASGQMQQEVRNLFPTVANTGVIPHHHAPPAASWDAPADAVSAAKEVELEARRSKDGAGIEGGEGGPSKGEGQGSSSSRRSSRAARQQQKEKDKEQQRRAAQQLSVVMDDEVESVPDWAEERAEKLHQRRKQGSNQGPSDPQATPLLEQQRESSDGQVQGASSSSGTAGLFSKYGVDLASLAEKYGVSKSALEDVLRDPKRAAAAAEEKLKAAAHEAEERLKGGEGPGGCFGGGEGRGMSVGVMARLWTRLKCIWCALSGQPGLLLPPAFLAVHHRPQTAPPPTPPRPFTCTQMQSRRLRMHLLTHWSRQAPPLEATPPRALRLTPSLLYSVFPSYHTLLHSIIHLFREPPPPHTHTHSHRCNRGGGGRNR